MTQSKPNQNAKWRSAKRHAESFGIKVTDDMTINDMGKAIRAKQENDNKSTVKPAEIVKKLEGEATEVIPKTAVEVGETSFTMHHHSHAHLPPPHKPTPWEIARSVGNWLHTWAFGATVGVISTLLLLGRVA